MQCRASIEITWKKSSGFLKLITRYSILEILRPQMWYWALERNLKHWDRGRVDILAWINRNIFEIWRSIVRHYIYVYRIWTFCLIFEYFVIKLVLFYLILFFWIKVGLRRGKCLVLLTFQSPLFSYYTTTKKIAQLK